MSSFVNLYPLTKGWNDAQWDMRKQALFDVKMPAQQAEADYMVNSYYPSMSTQNAVKTDALVQTTPTDISSKIAQGRYNAESFDALRGLLPKQTEVASGAYDVQAAQQPGNLFAAQWNDPASKAGQLNVALSTLDHANAFNLSKELGLYAGEAPQTPEGWQQWNRNITALARGKLNPMLQERFGRDDKIFMQGLNPPKKTIDHSQIKNASDFADNTARAANNALETYRRMVANPAGFTPEQLAAQEAVVKDAQLRASAANSAVESLMKMYAAPQGQAVGQVGTNDSSGGPSYGVTQPTAPSTFAPSPAGAGRGYVNQTQFAPALPAAAPVVTAPTYQAAPSQVAVAQAAPQGRALYSEIAAIDRDISVIRNDLAKATSLNGRRFFTPDVVQKMQEALAKKEAEKSKIEALVLEQNRSNAYQVTTPAWASEIGRKY
jgi:hypothetical protein